MPKNVGHGLKVSLKSSTRRIVKSDETLVATEQTLNHWQVTVSQLLQALVANENIWNSLFASYSSFYPIATNIYPAHDNDALECVAALNGAKDSAAVETKGTESLRDAIQRMDIAKSDLNNLLGRIAAAKKMHTTRVNQIREAQYYKEKSDQLFLAESTKKQLTDKAKERRERNVDKSSQSYEKVNSITNQLFYEMDSIAVERLAATDRALSALLLLQQHYFETNPISNAYEVGARVGLGRRVLIRDEARPWLPLTYQGVSASTMPNVPEQPMKSTNDQVYAIPPYNPNMGTSSPQISGTPSTPYYIPDNNYGPQTAQLEQPVQSASILAQSGYMNQHVSGYSPFPDPNAAPSSLAAPIPSASVPTQTNPSPPAIGPPMPGQSPQPIYTDSPSSTIPTASDQMMQSVQSNLQGMQISPGASQNSIPQPSQGHLNHIPPLSSGPVFSPQPQPSQRSPLSPPLQ